MRKWTYLVAALLMSGTAATFTSCIDTEEPAGITDLRGAKAELLRAKAAYQTALANEKQADADFRLVQVEREKIELEMDKLRQEMMAAENEWKKDSLQARRDTLAASLQIKLTEMQEKKAQADYELQKALEEIDAALITMKDNIYGQKISYYRVLLSGGTLYKEDGTESTSISSTNSALSVLENAENELIKKQILMTKFVSESATTEADLTANLAEKKALLEIQQGLLDDLNEIEKAKDLPALNQQLADKKNDLAALDTEEADKWKEVLDLRAKSSTAQELADLQAKLDTPDEYVVKKADVKSETMYKDLKDYLSSINQGAADSFTQDAEGKWQMNKDVVFSISQFIDKGNDINNILNSVKSYQYKYNTAYYNITGEYVNDISEMFNIDGSLKDVYRAKVDNYYDRWAIDAEVRKATAEADLAAWLKAYENYMTALKNYKNYQGTEAYTAVSEAINEYNALENTKKDLTAANAIRKTIYDYAVLREAADGHEVTYYDYTADDWKSFIQKYKDPIPAVADGTPNTELDNFNSYCWNLNLGNAQLSTSFWGTVTETNTLGIYLTATETVFGEYGSIETIVQPEAYQEDETTKYRMPADYEPTGGSYALYLADANIADIITDIDNWAALYKIIYDDGQTVTAEIAEVYKQITDLQINSLEELKVLWAAEVELYLIKGNEYINSTIGGSVFSTNNPYETYYTNSTGIPTKKSVLENEITLLETAIRAGSLDQFSAVLYNPAQGGYHVYTGTLDAIIDAQEITVETASDNVVEAQLLLDLFKEHGFNGATSGTTATENNCKDILQNAIDKQTEIVKIKNDEVERLKSVLEELLAAATAE